MINQKTRKCLVWGIGKEYDSYTNQIHFEILKENIDIIAYVSRDLYCREFEGKPVIYPNDIQNHDFEYIIICNTTRFQEICGQAQKYGVSLNKLIDARQLLLPCFDFSRYINLLENPVTIIADDCWGANVYHYLKLKFTSPFILCYMMSEDYLKVIQNLPYYIQEKLELYEEGDRNRQRCPRGMIGTGDSKVILNFNHSISFEKAREDWEERKKRINWDNIFVKMTIIDEETAEIFGKLPYRKKVAFSSFQSTYESVKYLCEWNWNIENTIRYIGYDFMSYARNSLEGRKAKDYDILKLLNGELDYMRKTL